ncbi:hypothetical protein Mapa_016275 [Marchantia paleacea]|nr:hypothetical protein Mapa_016275 [Marchantia paleacea]
MPCSSSKNCRRHLVVGIYEHMKEIHGVIMMFFNLESLHRSFRCWRRRALCY